MSFSIREITGFLNSYKTLTPEQKKSEETRTKVTQYKNVIEAVIHLNGNFTVGIAQAIRLAEVCEDHVWVENIVKNVYSLKEQIHPADMSALEPIFDQYLH